MDNTYVYCNLKKQLIKLKKLARRAAKDPKKETIHKLRTSIKKLRALYRLLKYLDHDFPYKKLMKPWKAIYRYYAPIRDKQVMNQLADNYGISATKNRDNAIGSKFPGKTRHIIKISEIEVKKTLGKHHEMKLDAYFQTGWQKIMEIIELPEVEKMENIHTLRKIVKDLNFNLRYQDQKKQKQFKPIRKWMAMLDNKIGKQLDTNMLLKSGDYTNFSGSPKTINNMNSQLAISSRDQLAGIYNLLCEGQILLHRIITDHQVSLGSGIS